MSILHAYFNLRRQNDFQRYLEQSKASVSNSTGPQPSSGSGSGPGSRSWTKIPPFSSQAIDVNARDCLGRTVLHLTCSAIDPAALEYTRLLLAHPYVNVNLQDQESSWSAFHRALYVGNLSAAILLLQRGDTDMFLKDSEGYTPFDVYNSTVAGTNPTEPPDSCSNAELYTWGSNRNAALGLGDGDDRALPEKVVIKPSDNLLETMSSDPKHLLDTLKPIAVVNVVMSKLHTTIITGEERGNLRSCGFSSSGRLGPGAGSASHTHFSLINPQETLPHKVTAVALGQDHTLAVTSNGEVLSWGLNRFQQLGYAFEDRKMNTQDDQIQAAARKITGPLRNQVVIGVACCKTASVCWTSSQLFSWGMNHGQLGYERTSQPQVTPRLVSYVSEPVIGVAMTDTAMLVLLKSRDVICLHDGDHWRLQFASQRPLRAHKLPAKEKTEIRKVIACESSVGTFALVSEAGDVYLLNTEEAQAQRKDAGKDLGTRRPMPHLIWGVRRQFSAVKDVGLGSDGSMILCTRSGHVFVRTRVLRAGIGLGSSSLVNPPKNSPIFKFHRVPTLQRIIKVCANSTGAFAALRLDAKPKPIQVSGRSIAADLDTIQPFRSWARQSTAGNSPDVVNLAGANEIRERWNPLIAPTGDEDEAADSDVAPDIRAAMELCEFLMLTNSTVQYEGPQQLRPLSAHHGADILFRIDDDHLIPAHTAVLMARIPVMGDLMSGKSIRCATNASEQDKVMVTVTVNQSRSGQPTVKVTGCSPMTVLILCYYLYTDKVVTVWDRRVDFAISDEYGALKINVSAVKAELRVLASQGCFNLPSLEAALKFVGKAPSTPTLNEDIHHIFGRVRSGHDVVVLLADEKVKAHSFVLRCRSNYFSTFFDEECWTMNRFQLGKGLIEVDLKEFKVLPMSYLFRYLYGATTQELFCDLDFIQTSGQFIDFMFGIIACSNHLLLGDLTDICSANILQFVDLYNISSVLVDAQHLNAAALVTSLHGYMTENLETLMEMHALDDLPQDVLKTFSVFLRNKQADHHPHIRRGANIPALERKWEKWLQLQDFPAAFAPRYLLSHPRSNPTPTSQPMSPQDARIAEVPSPITPRQRALTKSDHHQGDDDIFPMDGDGPTDKPSAHATPKRNAQSNSPTVTRGWKSPLPSDRVDMRAIMEAEKQASGAKRQPASGGSPSKPRAPGNWTTRPLKEPHSNMSKESRSLVGLADGSPPSRMTIPAVAQGSSASPFRPSPLKKYPTSALIANAPVSRSGVTSREAAGPISSSPSDKYASSSKASFGNLNTATQPKDKTAQGRHLGPLIVPVKSSAAASLPVRRSVSGDGLAWSNKTPSIPQVVTQGLSFAAIQEQQAIKPLVPGPPKSLREIQDEEQEVAFLTWFEEESARLRKHEEDAASASLSGERAQRYDGQTKRGGQAKRGRGGHEQGRRRGRGHGQGRGASEVPTSTQSVDS